jgi:hypothetical protein
MVTHGPVASGPTLMDYYFTSERTQQHLIDGKCAVGVELARSMPKPRVSWETTMVPYLALES